MRRIAFVLILAAAAAARLWYLTAGIPNAVGIDEPQVIDRAIRILRTGDWNAHIFDYPTLVIYFHACVAIARFLWGALAGQWRSLDGFTVAAIYATGRFAAAMVGVATVWLTYRLGVELGSRPVALLAAAQLAVWPLHVRESHFILTDVPMTALTTLTVWLSARAMRRGTVQAYGCAGAACGLAAAAKYNGGIAIVAVLAAWLLGGRRQPHRRWTLAAALGAAAVAFLAAAPYTLLDMPGFLNGFAVQFSRFAAPAGPAGPAWLLYVKHLSPAWARFTIPLALAGMVVLLWHRRTRRASVPAIVFAVAYFYVLASHTPVFGRYALPLVPMLAVFLSAAALEAVAAAGRLRWMRHPVWRPLLTAAILGLLLGLPGAESVRWLDQSHRADTRTLAADWLSAHAPAGARVAVENSGPTYLQAAGFKPVGSEMLIEHPVEWYRARADYLVISAADLARYGDYVAAGPTVFQVSPTPQRWGPPILIVALR
jgi:4-amino-4-deoxy-L-arabinose transferase-like glycosyltransferase